MEKKVEYKAKHSIDTAMLRAYDKEHPERGVTSPQEKMLLYSIVRFLRPQRMIEIGVSGGHLTLWLAAAIHNNWRDLKDCATKKPGKLISVDNWSRHSGGQAGSKAPAYRRLKQNGLQDIVNFVTSDSLPFLKKLKDNCVDFVWIDGGHTFDEARADIIEAFRVAKRAVMVHDTKTLKEVRRAVRSAEAELKIKGTFLDGFRGMWMWTNV